MTTSQDLITEDDVVFETGKDDQIESGVDHSDVSAEGVTSAEEGTRQPIAHRSDAQRTIGSLFETVRGVVMRSHEFHAMTFRLRQGGEEEQETGRKRRR